MDLHLANPDTSGACSAAVARALLDHTIQEHVEGKWSSIKDIVVITGQGRGSVGEAVLPAATRQFLTKELDPPLEIVEDSENPGRFTITGDSICAYCAAATQGPESED